jgi:hypothetical protein
MKVIRKFYARINMEGSTPRPTYWVFHKSCYLLKMQYSYIGQNLIENVHLSYIGLLSLSSLLGRLVVLPRIPGLTRQMQPIGNWATAD